MENIENFGRAPQGDYRGDYNKSINTDTKPTKTKVKFEDQYCTTEDYLIAAAVLGGFFFIVGLVIFTIL